MTSTLNDVQQQPPAAPAEQPDLKYLDDEIIDLTKIKLRTSAFSEAVRGILEEPVDEKQISVTTNGRIYMTHIWYRQRFNRAFGHGAWTVLPLCDWIERAGRLTRDYALFVEGRYVTEASSSHQFREKDDLGEARESVRSGVYVRLGKDLGVALELWNRPWVAQFCMKNIVCVGFWTRKIISEKWTDIIDKGFRLATDMPLEGEVGPWVPKKDYPNFYDDRNAPTAPVTGNRFAPYALPEGFALASGQQTRQAPPGQPAAKPTGTAPNAASGQPAAKSGDPQPAPQPAGVPQLSAEEQLQAAKANQRFVYDQLSAAHGTNPNKLGETLEAMTNLVLGVKIRSYRQLNYAQSVKLRESLEKKKFDPKTLTLSV